MPFPESPRVFYKDNPLAEVICQLRFPIILRISTDQLASFQDRIRDDYPLYEPDEPMSKFPQLAKEFTAFMEQLNLPKMPGEITHKFYNKDKSRHVAIAQNFLAIAESKYHDWNSFREEMTKVEQVIKELYNPSFYTRIGLRYQDIISRDKLGLNNEDWSTLLKPYIIAELGDERVSSSLESIQTRSVFQIPDIQGARVNLNHGIIINATTDEKCYIIDADFFIEDKEGLNEPFTILDGFNKLAGRLFRWAITDKLHEAMGPENN